MALSKNINYKGIDISNAYIKVWRIDGDKNKLKCGVGYYASSSSSVLFNSETHEFSYDINGVNPIQQAYEHLKTLSEFSGATDC